jgi:hypothetical protein
MEGGGVLAKAPRTVRKHVRLCQVCKVETQYTRIAKVAAALTVP